MCPLFAQDKALEKIKNYPKEDSVKVEMMVDYCVNSTFQHSPKILKLAQEAAAISKKINYKIGEIHSLSCTGNYYYQIADYPKASESIGLFSELSRAVLESSRSNEIALFDELELLKSYMKLECMRMPKIRYSIDTAEDLRLYDLFLPPMIVQPIVENSVKHGLANKEEGGLIQLRFSSFDDRLVIEIEDDGIGREAAGKIGSLKKRKGSSFSTEANLNRIELLNESYGLAITQEIVDNFDENGNATGTLISITIPQNNF